jgi:hypothetical protein
MKALFVIFFATLGLAAENKPESEEEVGLGCHHFVPPSLLIRSPGMENLQRDLSAYLLEDDDEADSEVSSSEDEGYEPSSDEEED